MLTARGRLLVARVAALALRDARPRLSRSLHQAGTRPDLTVGRRGWGSQFDSLTTRVQRISYRFPSLDADVPPQSTPASEPDVAEPVSSAADVADSFPPPVEEVEVQSDGTRLDPSDSSTAAATVETPEVTASAAEATSSAAEATASAAEATASAAEATASAAEATPSADVIQQPHTATSSLSGAQTIERTTTSSPAAAPETSVQQRKEAPEEARLQYLSSAGGTVYALLDNAPKYILKSDILRFFEGSGLKAEDIVLSYDNRYRAKYWYIQFESMKQFNIASGMAVRRKNMWTRPIRLSRVRKERMLFDLRAAKDVANFSESSLIIINLPEDVKVEDLERLFDGNRIAAHGIRIFTIMHEVVKTPPRLRLQGERRNELYNVLEKRAVVKFESELEALRALREKQGDFVFDREVQLKFLR